MEFPQQAVNVIYQAVRLAFASGEKSALELAKSILSPQKEMAVSAVYVLRVFDLSAEDDYAIAEDDEDEIEMPYKIVMGEKPNHEQRTE